MSTNNRTDLLAWIAEVQATAGGTHGARTPAAQPPASWPASPLEYPDWAVDYKYTCDEWPVVTITFEGPSVRSESTGVSVQVNQEIEIVVDRLPRDWNQHPDGTPIASEPDIREVGDVRAAEPVIYFEVPQRVGPSIGGYVTLDQAAHLKTAFDDVLNGMRYATAVPA